MKEVKIALDQMMKLYMINLNHQKKKNRKRPIKDISKDKETTVFKPQEMAELCCLGKTKQKIGEVRILKPTTKLFHFLYYQPLFSNF